MDELIVIFFVVGAADAVVPLPAAVLLVPVAGDQMAEPLVAEGRKGEHVPGAALNVPQVPKINWLICLFLPATQPFRHSSQLAVRADGKRNSRSKVDRGVRGFFPSHRLSWPDRPWSRGARTSRSWRGACGRKKRWPRTFCTVRGGAWTETQGHHVDI